MRGPEWVIERLRGEQLAPLTPVGDEFQAVGVVCLGCGETLVTMPERIQADRPGWFGCQRCSAARKRSIVAGAADVFAEHGLVLLGRCTGEYVDQTARCRTCGSVRNVSYRELITRTAPLCCTCTHGIRVDEPHRVYLIRFDGLGVWKVGITHNRHDRRLLDHALQGGTIVETILVEDRAVARLVETYVKAKCAGWRATDVGPEHFPQGGWTETWRVDGPTIHLGDVLAAIGVEPVVSSGS